MWLSVKIIVHIILVIMVTVDAENTIERGKKSSCDRLKFFFFRSLHVEMYHLSHHFRRFLDVSTLLQVYMSTGDGILNLLLIPRIAVSRGASDQ